MVMLFEHMIDSYIAPNYHTEALCNDIKKLGVFMPVISITAFISFPALKCLLKDVISCLHLKGRGLPHVPSKVLIG